MYSDEHKVYLYKIKANRILVRFTQIIIMVLFLIIWQILADKNIINSFISSSPKEVFKTIIRLHKSNNLYHHIFITVYETLISFLSSTMIGIIVAAILWWNKFLSKVFDPYLTILNSLPKVALGPIIIIWAGAGMKSIIIMALLISTIITIQTVYQAFTEVNINKLKLMKSFSATKRQTFFKLILPSSYSSIISSLKINISMSLVGVIMGEFLVSKSGLGYLIMYGSQVFNLNLVVTGIFILAIVASFMYYGILFIERKFKKNKR
ncbi:MAG TPA: ABC transporter permease [Tenericutes bacterium]|nr:ABC transporter permease [Mycoplasmatota bacterium]